MKPGTLSLGEEDTPVVVIPCSERLSGKISGKVEQVTSRGVKVLFIDSKIYSDRLIWQHCCPLQANPPGFPGGLRLT